jgi:general secretion pathway protein H
MSQSPAKEAGFTLMELIVVLFVLGLAASLVTISIGRSKEKGAFKDSLRKLYAAMRQARDTALLDKAPVSLNLDEDSFWLEKEEKPLGAKWSMPEGSKLEGKMIVFFPKGNSTGGVIIVKAKDERQYRVIVDEVTGIAKIEGP